MLSVADARRQILDHCLPLPAERIPLSTAALGRVLAEDVTSDVDAPPFDKALMDGYAVRTADLASGKGTLVVVEEITAGRTPARPVAPGQASRIMTGAPLPEGADAVVAVERTKALPDGRVEIDWTPRPGQNVLPRAREMAAGEVVLRAGTVLRPQEFGVLATVGRTAVLQVPPPRVAILATGDELVEPPMAPGPGQIRNSNAPMLLAQAARAGALPRYLGIGRDSLDSLRPLVQEALQTAHVLVLTGGVSAGKLDLVPEALREAGVTAHFHKVHLKPGKPLLFGTCDLGSCPARAELVQGGKRLVFGLPGNPVSSLVCFELFLRPALRRLAGQADLDLPRVRARLAVDFRHESDRPTYHPGLVELGGEGWVVKPSAYFGSADLRAYLQANALLVLPQGAVASRAGEAVDVLRLEV